LTANSVSRKAPEFVYIKAADPSSRAVGAENRCALYDIGNSCSRFHSQTSMDTFPTSLSFKSWQLFHHGPQMCPIRTGRDLAEDLPDQLDFLIFVARLRKAAHKILLVFNGDALNGRSWTVYRGMLLGTPP
jgi:hypothetical protein